MIALSHLGRYGRLGNQMFQYAAAYNLAKIHNTSVSISSFDSYHPGKKNQLIETFCLPTSIQDDFSKISFSFYEDGFDFQSIDKLPNNIDIIGYFQSEKYFLQHKDDLISKEFKFLSKIEDHSMNFLSKLSIKNEICSIHIRRGDYLNLSATHPVLDLDYYEKSINKLSKNVDFFIFSDDIENSKKIINSISFLDDKNIHFINENYSIDLFLMTKCNYHIMANSSFSWWGAWLSNSKKVFSPKDWFGPKGPRNWSDIYCQNWEII